MHYSALKVGASDLPLTGMLTACAFLALTLIPKIGARAVVAIGAGLATCLVLFSHSTSSGGLFTDVVWAIADRCSGPRAYLCPP